MVLTNAPTPLSILSTREVTPSLPRMLEVPRGIALSADARHEVMLNALNQNSKSNVLPSPNRVLPAILPQQGYAESVFVLDGEHLAKRCSGLRSDFSNQILEAGGRIILLYKDRKNIPDMEKLFPGQSPDLIRERVRIDCNGVSRHAWTRDYLGPVLHKGSQFVMADAGYKEELYDKAESTLRNKLGISALDVNLTLEWGNVVPIGNDAIIINEGIFESNSSQTRQNIIGELKKLGRERIIVLPDSKQFFHADLTVNVVNNIGIIPEVTADTAKYFATRSENEGKIVTATQKYLDDCADIIGKQGFKTLRVPLYPSELVRYGSIFRFEASPGCLEPNPPRGTISPSNALHVRDANGKLTVLVPYPEYQDLEKSYGAVGVEKFVAQSKSFKAVIEKVYRQAGAQNVIFTGYDIFNLNGLNHCRTAELPLKAASQWFSSLPTF
jgi:hypothetical protein